MGLLDLAFPGNPFSGWLDQNRNKVTGAFGGLAGAGNDPRGALQGFVGGLQGGVAPDNAFIQQQQLQAEKTAAVKAEQDKQNQTIAWLKSKYPQYANLPPAEGFQLAMAAEQQAMRPDQPVDQSSTAAGRMQLADQLGLSGNDRQLYILTGNMPGGNQTGRAGVGQPVTMRNKTTGETIAVQPMTVGPGQNLMTGEPLQNPEDWVYDPVGLTGDKTTAVADAKNAALARAALPGAELAAEQTLKAIDIIRNDTAGATDQFGNTFGVPNRSIPSWAGVSPRSNWQANFSTAESGAFMAARNALKGGGQITDYEGQKASAAYSRMQQAVNLGDKPNFDLALADFEQAVNEGLAKLRAVANGEYAAGKPAVTGLPPNTTSSGIQWSVTP